jgi:anthranilate/para-aminobenzoate synthase component II
VRVLMVDNYDSFTYNLVQYLGELGAEPVAVRNDAAEVDDLLAEGFDRVVVSPGPCTPNEAGMSIDVMRRFPEAGIPALGVCLGHQSLVQAFGGRVVRHIPVHGKATLIADPELPEALEVTARGDGVVMAVRHRELPAAGVQFHPESVLTPDGKRLLENFLGDPH